ncbi:hypothetical protein [Marisediminicola senii]|nr:hypothetical protein [Marisediminicola senii]
MTDTSTTNTPDPTEAPTSVQHFGLYVVPVDPMDALHCDSCQ